MGWGKNQYDLVRIPVRKPCKGYYCRWYYNGWHYWFFLPGSEIFNTEGEEYRTLGTKKVTMSSGQVTLGQCAAIRTILNTREIYLYGDVGWANVRVDPGSTVVYNNQVNGYEIELTMIIGSKSISRTGFTPILPIPDVPIVPIAVCEVTIGTQIWMCKNYDSKYPGSKVYNDNEYYRSIYGGLYTYNQVVSAGFCPTGWHVPTLAEWLTLIAYIEGISGAGTAGGELKDATTTYWNSPNTGATDTYGFGARGAGELINGIFSDLLSGSWFWTTDYEPAIGGGIFAYVYHLSYQSAALAQLFLNPLPYHFSVRLIKDTPALAYDLFDIDGNIYTEVIIGTQAWMVENLRTTRYKDGTAIPYLPVPADWAAEDGSAGHNGAYCYYNDDVPPYKATYGAMYNNYACQNAHGLAVRGWRIPTKTDFDTLGTFCGGSLVDAGQKLKEAGFAHWGVDANSGTDIYGWKGLPGDLRQIDGIWLGGGVTGGWGLYWTTTEDILNPGEYWVHQLYFDSLWLESSSEPPQTGFNVKLVRDV